MSTPETVDRLVHDAAPTWRQRQSYPVMAEPPLFGADAVQRTCLFPPDAAGAKPWAGTFMAVVVAVPLGDHDAAAPMALTALNCASYCVPLERLVRVKVLPVVVTVVLHETAPTSRHRHW